MLDYVGNVLWAIQKKDEKIPVDVLCSILAVCTDNIKSSLPNKIPFMLELMCAQFEQRLIDCKKIFKYSSC